RHHPGVDRRLPQRPADTRGLQALAAASAHHRPRRTMMEPAYTETTMSIADPQVREIFTGHGMALIFEQRHSLFQSVDHLDHKRARKREQRWQAFICEVVGTKYYRTMKCAGSGLAYYVNSQLQLDADREQFNPVASMMFATEQ